MTLDTFDGVLYAVSFLVPGFIWSVVLSVRLPRRTQPSEFKWLEFLTLSCINHVLWIWLLVFVFAGSFLRDHPLASGLLLLLPILVSPLVLGILSSTLHEREWPKRLLGRLGFAADQFVPTAWDHHFFRRLPYWVIVTLCDGSSVAGFFGEESFAGDDPGERDLYIEKVFRIVKGDWMPIADSRGILVKSAQIAAIEFREIRGVKYV